MDSSVDALTDFDINMDLETDVDWYSWVESIKNMETDSGRTVNQL